MENSALNREELTVCNSEFFDGVNLLGRLLAGLSPPLLPTQVSTLMIFLPGCLLRCQLTLSLLGSLLLISIRHHCPPQHPRDNLCRIVILSSRRSQATWKMLCVHYIFIHSFLRQLCLPCFPCSGCYEKLGAGYTLGEQERNLPHPHVES